MYATLDDMIARYGGDLIIQVSDRADPPIGSPDPAVVDVAIADAAECVHGYVAGRYAVPLKPVPESIRRVVCDLALYYLYREGAPDDARKRYEDAITWLKDVGKGVIQLPAASAGGAGTDPAPGTVQAAGPDRVFGAHDMWGY